MYTLHKILIHDPTFKLKKRILKLCHISLFNLLKKEEYKIADEVLNLI